MQISPEISVRLLDWYRQNKRPLPWRMDREPYHIWISEIMCQQTRVEAVKGYYSRFLSVLPDILALASCSQEVLYKLWEGLGYYSRAKYLKRAAEQIVQDYQSIFPREYDTVRSLPGIGDYTAAAICSICYDAPYPAVDGNVLRVVTRLLALDHDITLPQTKREIKAFLLPLFQNGSCGELNQALMELGALICIPNGIPACDCCPLSGVCRSCGDRLWKTLPIKKAKKARRIIAKTVLILRCGNRFALIKRSESGLLAGLWAFPSLDGKLTAQDALKAVEIIGCCPKVLLRHTDKKHIFTHLEWDMRGYYMDCDVAADSFTWETAEEIRRNYSLPTAYRQFFDDIE